jgi:hypothetical protein
MYRKLALIAAAAVMLLLMACPSESEDAGDVTLSVSTSVGGYVWDPTINIAVTAENSDKVEKVTIWVDDVIIIEDALEPYGYSNYSTSSWDYGMHEIKAKAKYEDGSSTTQSLDVTFTPCPIFEDDLSEISGITGRNSMNEPIGEPDPDDWHLSGDTTVGPAFPNPCATFATIMYSLPSQQRVSMIVLNRNYEIVETLMAQELKSNGDHMLEWIAPANVNDIFRVVFHAEDGTHAHGDIEVQ